MKKEEKATAVAELTKNSVAHGLAIVTECAGHAGQPGHGAAQAVARRQGRISRSSRIRWPSRAAEGTILPG